MVRKIKTDSNIEVKKKSQTREKGSPIRRNWSRSDKFTKIAEELIEKYDIQVNLEKFDGVFISSRFHRSLGKTGINRKTDRKAICLSRKLIDEYNKEGILRVMKHEVAHLVFFEHNRDFKRLCNKMDTHGTVVFNNCEEYKKEDE